MYEFFQAAYPWILLGLFVAVSCAFFYLKNSTKKRIIRINTAFRGI